MARRICQGLLTLALLYVAAVIGFALLHYGKGDTPTLVTAAGDMHRALAGLFAKSPDPVPEPGTIPPPRDSDALPPPPPPPTPLPTSNDPRVQALLKVSVHLLPEAEKLVRAISTDSEKSLDDRKADARNALIEARDVLGRLLDADRHDKEAHELYQRVMELLIAVDKR